jgi:hypothetical protein
MVWLTEVTGLTSIGFKADGSYHFLDNFRRPGKAGESYLTSISADGSCVTSIDELPSAYSRRKLGQNRRKKLIYVGFSLTSVGFWPTEVSIITVVVARESARPEVLGRGT